MSASVANPFHDPDHLLEIRRRSVAAFNELMESAHQLVKDNKNKLTPGPSADVGLIAAGIKAAELAGEPFKLDQNTIQSQRFDHVQQQHRIYRLRKVLKETSAKPEHALAVFETLVKTYEPVMSDHGQELIEVAMANPSWRDEAIKKHPQVFLTVKCPSKDLSGHGYWAQETTALHHLARLSKRNIERTHETETTVLRTMKTLESIGLDMFANDLSWGSTALTPAAMLFQEPVIRGFVQYFGKEALDKERYKGKSLLCLAVTWSKNVVTPVLPLLFELGVDPYVKDDDGLGVLEAAAKKDAVNVLRFLLSTGFYNQDVDKALLVAEQAKHVDVCKLLQAEQAARSIHAIDEKLPLRPL